MTGKWQGPPPSSGFLVILMANTERAVVMGPEEASAMEQEVDQMSPMPLTLCFLESV